MKPVLLADDTAFPAIPPPDLDDAAAIAAGDWAAFQQITHMRDHWNRPGWHEGRRALYWMITFPEHQALLSLARRCQHATAELGMDAIPEDGLHITMARVGENTIPADRLHDLAQAAAEQLPAAFTLTVGPLSGSYGALRFSVAPWGPLVEIYATLTEANQRFGLNGASPTSTFRPHLGIAYNPAPRPARPVIDLVAGLRAEPTVQVEVASVELVELRRESSTYKWDVLHRVPLPAR